jgi:hypothetical protein
MNKISSAKEWMKLPEIGVPELESQIETGVIESVVKVGFLGLSAADCRKAKIKTRPVLGLRCVLPTAVVDRHGKTELARLPLDLAPWVVECVGLAQAGRNQFPAQVEFGKLQGRVYAEFVLKPAMVH